MLKISPIETPIVLAAARSISRYSQGVLARKLVKTSLSDFVSRPLATTLSAVVLQLLHAAVAPVLDNHLEAAGGPEPVDGRSGEDIDETVIDLVLERRLQAVRNRFARKALGDAVVKVVEHHVHRAEIGRVGVEQDGLPGDGDGVLYARRLVRDLFNAPHDALRPLHRGRVGQLHVHQQIALVLRRNEALGRGLEAAVSQDEQAAVRHKSHDAETQQARRPFPCRC